jgi:hypothetical protein
MAYPLGLRFGSGSLSANNSLKPCPLWSQVLSYLCEGASCTSLEFAILRWVHEVIDHIYLGRFYFIKKVGLSYIWLLDLRQLRVFTSFINIYKFMKVIYVYEYCVYESYVYEMYGYKLRLIMFAKEMFYRKVPLCFSKLMMLFTKAW